MLAQMQLLYIESGVYSRAASIQSYTVLNEYSTKNSFHLTRL